MERIKIGIMNYNSKFFDRFYFLCLMLFLLVGTSCKKFLEERSQSDFTPKTTESYNELLLGTGYPLYNGMLHQAIALMDDDMEEFSPVVVTGAETIEILNRSLPAYSWQPDYFEQMEENGFSSGGNIINGYKNYFNLIMGVNVALQYCPESIGAIEDKNYLMGQAYALRAFYYFQLINLYGRPFNDSTTSPDKSLGVPLMLTANLSDSLPFRSTVAEVYKQIEDDLTNAFAFLDEEKRTGNIFRIDHVAAHLLASRVGLYTEDWEAVVKNADYVIQYHPVLQDFNEWMPRDLDPDGFPIFKPIIGEGNVETIWTYGSPYESEPQNALKTDFNISKSLVDLFESNDLRSQIYITTLPPFFAPFVSTLTASAKFHVDYSYLSGKTGCAFRSSEAYLNRAEAYAQLFIKTGDVAYNQKALADLNKLRENRISSESFVPWVENVPQALLQLCREERRRELFFEGQRWFDLRRYGMPEIIHEYGEQLGERVFYKLNKRDPQYTLPIPESARLLNPNLEQNPTGEKRLPFSNN